MYIYVMDLPTYLCSICVFDCYTSEITGARSSGIFMGIRFIAVGSLFKITAVPFRAAVGRPPIGGRIGWVVPLCGQSS